ncbi:hypothetical protein BC833DRAFT_624599 [Globomyces pollinis-pini]|nr:hypothetical protein BC833DRAFT_624599 [Globomyces pollinis-pini]
MNFKQLAILFNVFFLVYSIPSPQNDPGAAIRAKRVCPKKIAKAAGNNQGKARFAPKLGATPGLNDPVCQQNPNGDRISQVKAGVRIPCDCPPADRDFARQFAIDHGNRIKTDGSTESKKNNLRLAIQTLQGSFCCPAAAVTLNAQLASLN